VERPQSGPPHEFDVELEISARLVQGDGCPDFDLHALAWRPVKHLRPVTEHDAAHLRLLVLEREVSVS
jgi:hypothetical protein